MRRTQLYLDDDIWKALHVQSRQRRTSISDLVRQAVRDRYSLSRLEVEDAQMPSGGSDEATPETSWTIVQVGGDVVYRNGGVVMRGPDIVGKPLWPSDGVVEFGDNHKSQAVWVFSLDASGTYAFSGVTIANDGRTSPANEITITTQKGALKVHSGAGMLLRVSATKS